MGWFTYAISSGFLRTLTYEPFDIQNPVVSPKVRERIEGIAAELAALGFASRGTYRSAGNQSNVADVHKVEGLVCVFENPKTRESCRVVFAFIGGTIRSHMCMFRSDFPDRNYFATGNNAAPGHGLMAQTRRVGTMSFPQIHEVSQLLPIHRARVPTDSTAVSLSTDVAAYLTAGAKEQHALWIKSGRYRLDPATGRLVMTWKGAVISGLRFNSVMKMVLTKWKYLRAERVLRRLREDGVIAG